MKFDWKKFLSVAALFLLLIPTVSQAVPVATSIVADALNSTIADVTNQLQTLAFKWLSAFILAQFLITNIGLLKSGADIEAVIGKWIGGLAWFGFCFYVVTNGPDFIKSVGNGMFDMAGSVSGAPGIFSAGYVFDWGFTLSSTLMDSVNKATGSSWFAKLDFLPSLYTFFSCCVIMLVSGLIGFKVFLVKIELMVTIMMAPLSFSFLGLNALKDQGISPFKSLISLVYRVMLLAVLVSAMGKVGEVLVGVFGAVDQGSVSDVWNPVFAGLMIFSLMGYLAFKSDAMAANLASGSTNMGTADVASAAAMGAATGAAIATGGASVAVGAAKTSQSMGDVLKSLAGSGGGSVSNASSSGAGPAPTGQAPMPPKMSMGAGGQAAGNKAPVRSTFDSAGNNAKPGGFNPTPNPRSSSSGGSGTDAGISAPAPSIEQQLGDLVQAMNRPREEKRVRDHLSELNQHMAREQASTHVSINTHHSD